MGIVLKSIFDIVPNSPNLFPINSFLTLQLIQSLFLRLPTYIFLDPFTLILTSNISLSQSFDH